MMLLSVPKVRTIVIRVAISPAGRAFLISLTCWLLAFTYCRFRYWRDPHSAFFNSDHVYDWKYTAYRRNESLDFLAELGKQNSPPRKAALDPEICAAFVTVKREGEQYVNAAIGSMLQGLTEWERSKVYLSVLFADNEPSTHPTWGQQWLSQATDWTGTYNVSAETRNHLRGLMNLHLFKEKGVFDYLYVLKSCYETGAPYILIVEDDIILADSWLVKTKKAIQDIEKAVKSGKPAYNYLNLRIFYTETTMRWRETDFWFRRMDLLLALATCNTFIFLLIFRRMFPSTRKHLDNWALVVFSAVAVPAFIILLFMIGKYSLFPPNGVFVMNRYGCCSQALLYPRDRIPSMVKWFEDWNAVHKRPYESTDLMIDYYAREIGVDLLALGPPLAQHVGITSSRDGLAIDGRSTRAFWFDEYDPKRLKWEHDQLVKSLKG